MVEYKDERSAAQGYIRLSLDKLTNIQLDTYARMIQCCLENNKIKTKLGVGRPRNTLQGYIRCYMDRMTNAQLMMVVGDMMKVVEENNFWKLYDRPNWEDAW